MKMKYNTMQLVLGILLVLVCVAAEEADHRTESCKNSPVDVVLVLDTSDAVDTTSLQMEKTFLKEIVSKIFGQNNRLGLVTFGAQAFFQFHLSTYTSLNDINMAIDYMWRTTGQCQLEQAIQYAMENGFSEREGGRQNASNYLIVVALSGTLNSTQVKRISDRLQENMVELVLLDSHYNSIQNEGSINIHRLPSPASDTVGNVTETTVNVLCKEMGVLKPWSPWSACGVTCGRGIRRRFKECIKRRPNDICLGKKMESENCLIQQCTDPVNGGWTYWQEWSKCTKTCGTGVQSRQRECKAPAPSHGGGLCKGSGVQLKNCSQWNCPNCSYVCKNGTTLSSRCDICECPNTILFGTIVSESNVPIEKIGVYIETKPYEMLGSTDIDGTFMIQHVCLRNTTIMLRKEGYVDVFTMAKYENETHWNITTKMERIVPPVIMKQPENKVRLLRQDATLCCVAAGRPKPDTVQWYKDGDELNETSERLRLVNISHSDAGIYSCSVETEAGIIKSHEAAVDVFASAEESCSRPLFNTRKLPKNCYAIQHGTNSTIIDVGKCSRDGCITKSFKDNGTCIDTENDYCCNEGQSEEVQIYCPGFSYSLKRITSCTCKRCLLSTIVEGSAYGKHENGSKTPFAYGYLFINGKKAAVSNEMGYFQFEVFRNVKHAVVYFVDEVFQKFVPTTKVINTQRDSLSFITVVLPLKPRPVEFQGHLGISVNLGGSNNFPPAGGLTIPEHALVTADGHAFTGKAKATVHFMDPRKLTDLEASNGNFIYTTDDGTTAPLDTFGMFHTSVEDDIGRSLKIKKKLTFTLDASIFNVSLKDDGSPDLALWNYDINNGIWVETSKMKFSDSSLAAGRRKLLDHVLVGEFEVQEIKQIDLTEEKPVWERVIIGYTNCDHSVPIYAERIVTRESKTKHNACYLSVSVYSDLTYGEKSDAGTNVVAITQEMHGPKFKGMDSKTTDRNGHVCLSVFCDSKVYVYAESKFDGSRLFASTSHDLPVWYDNFNNTKNGTEVEIFSYNIEDVVENGKSRYSPFVLYEDFSKCSADFDKNYKFEFAYYAMPHTLTTSIAKDTFDEKLSWYPVSPEKPYAKACFIKVAITTDDNNARFIAESYQDVSQKNSLYGSYDVGPSFDINSANRKQRAACIEFRCAGRFSDNGKIKYNSKTIVEVYLISSEKCTLRTGTIASNITLVYGRTGFRFVAEPTVNYGPKFGIYVGNGKADKIRNFCASGTDTGAVEKFMKPSKNAAIEYSCT
ncbi:cartilage intermediate layer protein 1-like [Mercenaria mercenaria]|uniref:cartilage intermediate layer protein 1-like n=1 Tax=Mercenaria mercenaria TaxID=6596 RepID=UPI00234EECD0|nr:cartilage intermediate layer protein 1-like [Mercenaria mercenaria]